jgi:hypothetical protein
MMMNVFLEITHAMSMPVALILMVDINATAFLALQEMV